MPEVQGLMSESQVGTYDSARPLNLPPTSIYRWGSRYLFYPDIGFGMTDNKIELSIKFYLTK